MREAAREFALQYDTHTVYAEYWKPALAEIEEKMGKPTPLVKEITADELKYDLAA